MVYPCLAVVCGRDRGRRPGHRARPGVTRVRAPRQVAASVPTEQLPDAEWTRRMVRAPA
jgi:hypothetical protein